MRRSDDAGGAATSDGASARGGAGMNDDGRGLFSAETSQFATGPPLEVTRGRERRARFFSSAADAGRGAAIVIGFGAGFNAGFGRGFSAAFSGSFGAAFGARTGFGAGFAGTGAGALTAFN